MLAVNTLEGGAAAEAFRGVIAHIFHPSPLTAERGKTMGADPSCAQTLGPKRFRGKEAAVESVQN
jgi:hypothetical protein